MVEGVLMYFYEEQVKTVLKHIAERFSGGELWFDVCGKMMVKSGAKPDSLRKSAAEIRSGISDGHEVEIWVPALELIEQACYQKFSPNAGEPSCVFSPVFRVSVANSVPYWDTE